MKEYLEQLHKECSDRTKVRRKNSVSFKLSEMLT